MSEKCSAFNLLGELYQFERTLIDHQKNKLAVAASLLSEANKNLAVFRCMKNLADLADQCPTIVLVLWNLRRIEHVLFV